jgi:hypothetical protein
MKLLRCAAGHALAAPRPARVGLQSRRHLNGGGIAALILAHGIYSGDHASGYHVRIGGATHRVGHIVLRGGF